MDYTDFEKKPKKDDYADQMAGKAGFWWKETDAGYRAQCLHDAATALEREQSTRHNMNLLHARLYGNFDMVGFGPRQYMRGNISAASKIAFNVVEAATDTLASKISKHRPRPVFLTDGAHWKEQQKAKKLGKFSEGQFSNARVYTKDDLVFIDSCVFGTGGYKIVMREGKVDVERAFINEILIDEADARYGAPRQLIQGKLCHREKLLADYGSKSKEIYKAIMETKPPSGVEQVGFGDMVQVWEGWHLPSSEAADDGYHSIVMDGGTQQSAIELHGEKWNLNRFPFVFFHFKPRLLGFWGQGVAEILTGIQLELNRLVRSISEQLRRKGRGRIFAPLASKVPPEHFTNAVSDVIYYNGNVPPTVDNSNAVAQEEFSQIDRLYQKAFQLVGVSEMSVSAKKPSGLDAAVALREYEEIESERFAKQHQRWDTFHMELAEAMLDFVREFGGPGYITKYEHKRYMETIEWKDVKHEPGEYAIQIFPSSSLPQTPGARKQAVKELLADGFIDLATAQKLLDFPDLEAETNLGNAARDDVEWIIDRILYGDGEIEPPDKYTNLALLVERGTAAYLYAKNHDCPEDRLEALSAIIDQAAAKVVALKQVTPPAPPMPMGPGGPAAPAGPPPMPMGMPLPNMNPSASMTLNMPPAPAVPPNVTG